MIYKIKDTIMENVIILWLWWAWYTAWIYTARSWLNPLLIWENDWWTINENPIVENFPGFKPTSWFEIMENLRKQAEYFWARILIDKIINIEKIDKWYKIKTYLNWEFKTKTIIIALWTEKKKLEVPWEKELFWKWVSYCATCDWFFFKDKTVAVIWWWDSALIESLYLSNICKKVYLIHRREQFKWEKIRQEKVFLKENIEIIKPAKVISINWKDKVESITLDIKELKVDWVFIAIWTKPNEVPWLNLEKDENWYIFVDKCQKTNLEWVFAAWDITTWSCYFKQLVVACSEWAIAAESVFKYLTKTNEN